MLPWLRNPRNKYLFFCELTTISTVAHCVVGFFLFVVYRGGAAPFHLEIGTGATHRSIMFRPGHVRGRQRSVQNGGVAATRRNATAAGAVTGKGARTSKSGASKGLCAARARGAQKAAADQPSNASNSPPQRARLVAGQTMLVDKPVGKASASKKAPAIKKTPSTTREHSREHSVEKPALRKVAHAESPTNVNTRAAAYEKNVESLSPEPVAQHPPPPVDKKSKSQGTRAKDKRAGGAPHHIEPDGDHVDDHDAAEARGATAHDSEETCVGQSAVPPQSEAASSQSSGNERGYGNSSDASSGEAGEDAAGEEAYPDDGQDYESEYTSAEALRIVSTIECELETRWKPPHGLAKGLTCGVKVRIGGDGSVVACTIEESSGVLIYDMAARAAARALVLPRWACGREFVIAFKQ